MIKGRVHSLESFGSVDGPGIRYLIFLQGCPMRCRYCHNADTWDFKKGDEYTADELLDKAERYRSYWGDRGGITVSGGEPLMQIDFLVELFTKAKQRGINTCIDTSGQPFSKKEPFFSKFEQLCKLTDLFLVDIKHIDPDEHKKLTGHGNKNILELLEYLSQMKNVERVEVLPYHSMGEYKWQELGLEYTLKGTAPPDSDRIANAKAILKCS